MSNKHFVAQFYPDNKPTLFRQKFTNKKDHFANAGKMVSVLRDPSSA